MLFFFIDIKTLYIFDKIEKNYKGSVFMANKNLIDLDAMSKKQLDMLIKKAKKIMENPADYRHACDGKILATLFYEPSTRTQMSFHFPHRVYRRLRR